MQANIQSNVNIMDFLKRIWTGKERLRRITALKNRRKYFRRGNRTKRQRQRKDAKEMSFVRPSWRAKEKDNNCTHSLCCGICPAYIYHNKILEFLKVPLVIKACISGITELSCNVKLAFFAAARLQFRYLLPDSSLYQTCLIRKNKEKFTFIVIISLSCLPQE